MSGTEMKDRPAAEETEAAPLKISDAAPEGKLNDEAFAKARAMIGSKLRPEQFLRDTSLDTMTNFCNATGDLNPLFRDPEYARWTRFGGLIGHPTYPWVHHWPARSYWGFTGVHGFGIGIDTEFFRSALAGDRINVWNRVVDVQEKQSRFSGRMAIQFVESNYVNQRSELLCRCLGFTARHERKASREKGKYKDIKPHVYTDQELEEIFQATLTEPDRIRGQETRYWEDVEVGDKLDEIVRGPLSLSDTMAWVAACGRARAHGVLLREVARHPSHYVQSSKGSGSIEYTGIGHHRDTFARQVGVPGMYDYLPQRASWMASLCTNWMGDDAVLKRLRVEARMFNVEGDTTFCRGTISKKYVKDGCALVDIDLQGVNQRGDLTTPGMATVMLASRDINTKIPLDGTVCDLELPVIR